MNERSSLIVVLGGAVLMAVLSIVNIGAIVARPPSQQAAAVPSGLLTDSTLDLANRALSSSIGGPAVVYAGDFENPFRPYRVAAPAQGSRSAPVERVHLVLKGILIQDRPLAILEDSHGETFIRGIGEKVLGQEIVRIKANTVTLRDSRGAYDLSVEPN